MLAPLPPLAFGPVPSRRLGRSLGINSIPPKACTYSCVYCQVGRTPRPTTERRPFYAPARLAQAARERLAALDAVGETVDVLSFVPDGEPTLDLRLGEIIERLRQLGRPVAVFTNGSLLGQPAVRRALAHADHVSLKVDVVDEQAWRRLHRPAPGLRLQDVLDGQLAFAAEYLGTLTTETMLVRDLNDRRELVDAVGVFLGQLAPDVAYVAVPTRPPAEAWVEPPDEAVLNAAVQLIRRHVPQVELLVEDEGSAFAATGDAEADLLGVTAVHPLREDALQTLMIRSGAPAGLLERLLAQGLLRAVRFEGHTYYLRRLPERRRTGSPATPRVGHPSGAASG